MIEIDKCEYYQWDSKISLAIPETYKDYIFLFQNSQDQATYVVMPEMSDEQYVVYIPDICLQKAGDLYLYYCESVEIPIRDNSLKTIAKQTFTIVPREKPIDYIYSSDPYNYSIYPKVKEIEEQVGINASDIQKHRTNEYEPALNLLLQLSSKTGGTDDLTYTLLDDSSGYKVSSDSNESLQAIAATYENLPVIVVADEGFSNKSDLNNIYIPKSVASIGARAFKNCSNLKTIKLSEPVTSVGDYAFENCTDLKTFRFTYNVHSFGANPIKGCSNLKEILLDYGEVAPGYEVSGNAIYNDSLTTLIAGCNGTTSIDLYTQTIADEAFYKCEELTQVIGWDNLYQINNQAFYGCTGLTKIHITPVGVSPNIAVDAFRGCSNVEEIIVTAYNVMENTGNYSQDNCLFDNNTSKTIIFGCMNSVIPSDTKAIGAYAFQNCERLNNITLPSSLLTINDHAFLNCSGIKEITIPNSVRTIGGYAFGSCNSLEKLIIGEGLATIANGAFSGCKKLKEIYFNAVNMANLSTKNYVFDYAGSNGEGIYLTIGASATTIPAYLFAPYTSTTRAPKILEVKFEGNQCKSIGDYAFSYCSKLRNVAIGNGVTSIGNAAFRDCSSLTNIVTPDSVIGIGDYAFLNCSKLTNIIISNNATSIGRGGFYNCSKLGSVTIPDSITSIGDSAFANCSSLESITLPFVGGSKDATSASASTLFGYIFGTSSYTGGVATTQKYDTSNTATYYIPSSLKSVTITGGNILRGAFYNCSNLTSVTLGDGVSIIDYEAFYNCSNLTSIIIPDSVIKIKDGAFYNCSKLESITIGNGLTNIGTNAFDSCSGLKSVHITDIAAWCKISFGDSKANPLYYAHNLYLNGELVTNLNIPDNVTNISTFAFAYCQSLISIVIPDSVTSISNYVFNGCTKLTSATLPNRITSISIGMFGGCSSLTSVLIPESITSIGSWVFYYCIKLTSIVIPSGVTSIGANAFGYCNGMQQYDFSKCKQIPTLADTTVFTNIPSGCKIIVPASLVNDWKNATNWSTYASHIISAGEV